jgi:hypothetical protein
MDRSRSRAIRDVDGPQWPGPRRCTGAPAVGHVGTRHARLDGSRPVRCRIRRTQTQELTDAFGRHENARYRSGVFMWCAVVGNADVTPPPAAAAGRGDRRRGGRCSEAPSCFHSCFNLPEAGGTERDCRKQKGRKWSSPLTPVNAQLRFILYLELNSSLHS